MNDTLKECPFCGGEAKPEAQQFTHPPRRWIKCSYCGACSSDYSSAQSAIAAWNARKSPRTDMGDALSNAVTVSEAVQSGAWSAVVHFGPDHAAMRRFADAVRDALRTGEATDV